MTQELGGHILPENPNTVVSQTLIQPESVVVEDPKPTAVAEEETQTASVEENVHTDPLDATQPAEDANTEPAATEAEPVEFVTEVAFGDVTLTADDVTFPAGVKELLSEKGVDPLKVVAELYQGEFGISDETRADLEAKLGKPYVDMVLHSTEQQYNVDKQAYTDKQARADEAMGEINKSVDTILDGKEWSTVAEFTASQLTETAREELNKVLASGNQYMIELAVRDMVSKYDAANPVAPELIQASGGHNEAASTALTGITAAQYRSQVGKAALAHDYARVAELDAARKLGQQQGIQSNTLD